MRENSRDAFDDEEIVDAVLSADRVLLAIAAGSLVDAGEPVTLTQYRALVVLASRGLQSVVTPATALSVTPPSASHTCERLVRKRLVRRRVGRRDRRHVRLALTVAGRNLIDAVSMRRHEQTARPLVGIPLEEQHLVNAALHRSANSGEKAPEQERSSRWDF